MRVAAVVLVLFASVALAGENLTSKIVARYPLNFSGAVDAGYPGAQPIYGCHFDDAVGGTYVSEIGSITMAVNDTAISLISQDGTWPSGASGTEGAGWSLGASDYLNRTDDGTFDFSDANDKFSVLVVVTPSNIDAGTRGIVAKYKTTDDNRSWMVYHSAGTIWFGVDDVGDASGWEAVSVANCLAIGRMSFVTVTYDSSYGDGSCQARIYCDDLATGSVNNMEGPPYNSDADLTIGSVHGGANSYRGIIHEVYIWDGVVVTEAQHDWMHDQWRGVISTRGRQLNDQTSASPPSLVTSPPTGGAQPFIRHQPANGVYVGSPIANTACQYGAAAMTQLLHRSYFRTWAAGSPTGWTESNTGTGDTTQESTHVAVDLSSAKMATAAGGDDTQIVSNCVDINASKDYGISLWVKELSGSTDLDVIIKGYSNADCDADEVTEMTWNIGNCATSWTMESNTLDDAVLEGTTEYVTVTFYLDDTNGTGSLVISAPLFIVEQDTDIVYSPLNYAFCGNDADSSAACNHIITKFDNPLTASGWQLELTMRTPWDIEDAPSSAPFWYYVPGTAGFNNQLQGYILRATARVRGDVYDTAGTNNQTYYTGYNWDADNNYKVIHVKTHEGAVRGEVGGTSFDTTDTGALHTTPTTILSLPHNTTGYDICNQEFVVRRSINK